MFLFIIFCFIAYAAGGELWEICRYGLILGFVWAVVSEILKKRQAAKARKESRKADREARRARRELEAARKDLAAAVASASSAPSADDDEEAPSAPRMGLIARWKDEQRRMDEEAFCALDDDEETEDEKTEMEKNAFIERIEDPQTRARAYEILAETDLFPGETFEPLPDDADEDEAFSGIDREKEAKRLRRVLEGLYNKRDKLEYMGVKKNTQRWRGLEYDIAAAERRLAYFES